MVMATFLYKLATSSLLYQEYSSLLYQEYSSLLHQEYIPYNGKLLRREKLTNQSGFAKV